VRVATTLVLLLLLPASAWAPGEKRIALLIGNKDYKPSVGTLINPLNDTRIVGEALKAIGFEVLKPVHNARRAEMLVAIHEFAARLKAAGSNAVGFLYYSGHGIASAGDNYLMPIDLDEPSTVQLRVQGVTHSEVLAILRDEAPGAAHYLVLDACRNTLQGARGGKGFVPLGQQSGVLVAFAAEPGKTASDTGLGSGPYAAALAAELVKPGQSDLIMFHRVRVAVMERTHGDQVPWTEDGIQRRDRVLFGGESKPAAFGEAERAWAAVKDSNSHELLTAFARQFGDTVYGVMAREKLTKLEEIRLKYRLIAMQGNIASLERFVQDHPDLPQAAEARTRIQELKQQQVAAAVPVQPPQGPAPAAPAASAASPPPVGPPPSTPKAPASAKDVAARVPNPGDPKPDPAILKLIRTHPLFANAPPVHLKSYVHRSTSATHQTTTKGTVLNSGLVQTEGAWGPRVGWGSSSKTRTIEAGCGLFQIAMTERELENTGGARIAFSHAAR